MAEQSPENDSWIDEFVSVYCDHPSASIDKQVVAQIVKAIVARYNPLSLLFSSITVILSDRESIHQLNSEFLGHDYPTDVLSFLLTDENPHEGEVYVDLDTAIERYNEFGSSFETEAYRYVIHGVLHLLGMEDDTPDSEAEMHKTEDDILGTLSN